MPDSSASVQDERPSQRAIKSLTVSLVTKSTGRNGIVDIAGIMCGPNCEGENWEWHKKVTGSQAAKLNMQMEDT